MKIKKPLNKKYGRLTVIKIAKKVKRNDCNSYRLFYRCKCDCGNFITVRENDMRAGDVISCGCFRKELARKRQTTHGMKYTPFYGCWSSMKDRCLNYKAKAFKNYGGRGIGISNDWKNFLCFKQDMYKSYLSHVNKFGSYNTCIERINNEKGYSKKNCKWATRTEQQNNTRYNRKIIINRKEKTLTDWSKSLKISVQTLSYRLKHGYYNLKK